MLLLKKLLEQIIKIVLIFYIHRITFIDHWKIFTRDCWIIWSFDFLFSSWRCSSDSLNIPSSSSTDKGCLPSATQVLYQQCKIVLNLLVGYLSFKDLNTKSSNGCSKSVVCGSNFDIVTVFILACLMVP